MSSFHLKRRTAYTKPVRPYCASPLVPESDVELVPKIIRAFFLLKYRLVKSVGTK